MLVSRRLKFSFFAFWCLLLVVTNGLFGQAPAQDRAQGSDQTGKEVALKGTVENVAMVPANGRTDTHVKLKTGNQLVDVNLGPTRWLDVNQFSVARGDNLQVMGSTLKEDSREVFVARGVVSGDQRLDLQGGPGMWASSGPSGRGYCRGMGCGGGYCRGGGYCGNGGYCGGCSGSRGGCFRGPW
jgi:hypothetical protein